MTKIVSGLAFPEGPRWWRGALYFSDMQACEVWRWTPSGGAEAIASIPGHPSGIGFLDDRTLLVSSQEDRTVMRIDLEDLEAGPRVHADVSGVATWHLNDMVTDAQGRAYVGNYGNGAPPGEPIAPAVLSLVDTDGSVRPVAEDLYFPNGMALRADGKELVVAETRSEPGRLTVFDVAPDGSLSNRRVLVEFATEWPDGIARDAEDAVWVASPFSGEVIRVTASGEITDRLQIANPYAVALGGPDGRDLFVCTAGNWDPEIALAERTGAVEVLRVDVPAT